MRKLLTILFFAFCGCTKTELGTVHHCETCIELSYKYTLDSVYIKTDTLSHTRLCDSTLNVYKTEAAKEDTIIFRLCGLNMLEKRIFVYKP